MIVAAARRFLILLGAALAVAVTAGLFFALVADRPALRMVSLSLYMVGVLAVLCGFALGARSALRPVDLTPQGVSGEERADDVRLSRGASGVFITLGLIVVVIGLAVDPRVRLY